MKIEEIYNLYFKDIYKYIISLSGNEKIAEEITQETFFKAIKFIDSFDKSQSIKGWLFTIAKNSYFTLYNKNKKTITSDDIEKNILPQRDFLEKLADEETAFLIHKFLHNMKEPYKEIFNLRVFGELSFEKIGILFNKNSSWARVMFYRSKKQIIEEMEKIENERDKL